MQEASAKTYAFNIGQPIRIKQYIPLDPEIDHSHPNYLYQGKKYMTKTETAALGLDQQIVTVLYGLCYKESLTKQSKQNLLDCYKQKLSIFRDILQILQHHT